MLNLVLCSVYINDCSHFPRVKRASLSQANTLKPVPGGGKPRPAMKPKPALPKAKALYDYTAQDLDEMTFKEGDIIEIVKERKCVHHVKYFNFLRYVFAFLRNCLKRHIY